MNDIPYEVLQEFIMCHISIKEVGALSMVNTIWRDMCNDNGIWKVLYLRTVRAKVVDSSVHIGPRCMRARISAANRVTSTRVYIPWLPFDYSYTRDIRTSLFLLNFYTRSKCFPTELRDKVRLWSEIRSDGMVGDNFPIIPDVPGVEFWRLWDPDQRAYCDYIQNEWREYNRSKGLSTVNLCQCPDHYEFETLDVPGACRNFKSYKKITLKKLETQSKHSVKRASKVLAKEQREYEKMQRIMAKYQARFDDANKDFQKKQSLSDKISLSLN